MSRRKRRRRFFAWLQRILWAPVQDMSRVFVGDRPSYLYRLYDRNNRLLYVGVTYNVTQRVAQHRRSQPWAKEIHAGYAERYRSRKAVFRAETQTILRERPRYNVAKTGRNMALHRALSI